MEGGKDGADAALVEMRGIRKSFGSVEALRGVDFRVNAAEIVGLLGDNGAGKSTLIKVLSGLYGADAGTFLFRGRKLDWTRSCVSRARGLGIETVYQDRALGLQQSLWRNVFVGRHIKGSWGLIDVAEERRVTAELLARMGLGGGRLTPDTRAGVLSGGERQGLAIGRAMYFDAELVVLDEPTTALALSEVDKVLEFICGVRERGKSVVFITHSIDHVWAVADRFVVLSHGRNAGEWTRGELTLPELMARLREVAL
ncbi:ATP-binding cassette domain-containing protein [Fretibacterium fastidiosum]|uniref:ATP-binding cassette domain-containing protein n=1 Tax=Fretibacterium fastidiosum TaxID=651822 RepID=UPI0002E51022|nr:ATP-binding cassette domain-containing protein [Fretibacterium fastidiosum]